VGGAAVAYWQRASGPSASFRTALVKRGDLLVTVGATGTVEPEEVVDVGAQVAGKIESFGQDPDNSGKTIDYGSKVDEDTILARIDDALYAADVDQSAAQLEQAKANVIRAKADLQQMVARLHQAENNWKRAQELGPSRALSATDYDSYQATYETAKATVGVGEATVVQAEKAVVQAEANLKRSQTNLGYCTIRSPVKGVIVDRRVNIGQTVVASLNAPSLFLIAKDLTRIQVWVSVNEADIGNIRPGQAVTFTVDAHPGQVFHGTVGKIRLNASMTQNVVTYTVEINTDNSDGRLLPYLTANVQFQVSERKNVLMVPNAALRWKPAPQQISAAARKEFAGTDRNKPDAPQTTTGPARGGAADRTQNLVWVQDGAFVRPVRVTTGLSDGSQTEIQSDSLTEDTPVVIGEAVRSATGNETTNPFTPQVFGNRRQ
ncbi:MAG TPA: efflux RND transporter periplasmic adaptor subunit, partial [Phycisphaerae bacterium]|nr:efflux RND transporter periplasmic adaptor subunit [Phycisphaerae bacterium]